MTLWILISGKRCSGKSTLAEKIHRMYINNNITVSIIAIADALKISFCNANNLDIQKMSKYTFKENQRPKLLLYAKTKQNKIGETCWIDEMLQFIPNTQVVIVSDVRRKYELNAIINHITINNDTSVTIRINVPEWVRKKRGWCNMDLDSNIFETDLDDYTWDRIYQQHEF